MTENELSYKGTLLSVFSEELILSVRQKKCRLIVQSCLAILLLTRLEFWPQISFGVIREAARQSASHVIKEKWRRIKESKAHK